MADYICQNTYLLRVQLRPEMGPSNENFQYGTAVVELDQLPEYTLHFDALWTTSLSLHILEAGFAKSVSCQRALFISARSYFKNV
jgi:hypothetical protein